MTNNDAGGHSAVYLAARCMMREVNVAKRTKMS